MMIPKVSLLSSLMVVLTLLAASNCRSAQRHQSCPRGRRLQKNAVKKGFHCHIQPVSRKLPTNFKITAEAVAGSAAITAFWFLKECAW
jgi:hypothetical protein